MKPSRIIIFAKAPAPGFAKTRLIPVLGAQGAASLARRMLLHTLNEALAAGIGMVELCATPGIGDAAWRGVALPAGIEVTDQGEGDLGARMARAARRAIERGECVLLVGTDCPALSPDLLREALSELRRHDAVIHRAHDGGYVLLGLRRFDASLFADMPWGTDAVARLTLERLSVLGWAVHDGQVLHDIDAPGDLSHLPVQWRADTAV